MLQSCTYEALEEPHLSKQCLFHGTQSSLIDGGKTLDVSLVKATNVNFVSESEVSCMPADTKGG